MDPVSHVLFGQSLLALDRRRSLGAHASLACALGALAPDVDALFIAKGWDVYLRVHQVGTHSIAGSLVTAAAAAAVVQKGGHGRYRLLLLAAGIGALSHVFFDLCSGATLAPGWPLSGARPHLPLVAMADPWLIAVCTIGSAVLWFQRRRSGSHAAAVAMIVSFLVFKAALLGMAFPQWVAARGPDVLGHATETGWGSLTEWNVFDRTPRALRKWRVNALGGPAVMLFSVPLLPEAPIVTASRSLDTVRDFLAVHQFGFPTAIPLENGDTEVWWSDIRYCAPVISDRSVNRTGVTCALWFGGTLSRQGTPLTQTVRLGEWRQSRPAAP